MKNEKPSYSKEANPPTAKPLPLAGFSSHQSFSKTCTTNFKPKKQKTKTKTKQKSKDTYRFEEWGRDDGGGAGSGYRGVLILYFLFWWYIWVWSFSRDWVWSCIHHCQRLRLQNGGLVGYPHIGMGNRVGLGYLFWRANFDTVAGIVADLRETF